MHMGGECLVLAVYVLRSTQSNPAKKTLECCLERTHDETVGSTTK